MKKTCTLILLSMAAMAARSVAQPVITSSITSVPLGTIDSAYGASPTVLPGAGGAGVAWDMSTVPTIFAAKLTVVAPSSTPYATTFSSSTFCTKVEAASTTYNFDRQTSTGLEVMSLTYAGAGVGTDFSPNGRLSLPFPFHYLDSKSDSFQSTTSGLDTVRLTYDGYGSLKTPFYTYPDVIRIKEDYGTSYSYSWYMVSPFALIMNYSSTSNNYVIVTTPPPVSTAVRNTPMVPQASIFPNPTTGDAILKMNLSEYNNAVIVVTDVAGRMVLNIPITASETLLPTGRLQPGMYFYTVQNSGEAVVNGKLVINR